MREGRLPALRGVVEPFPFCLSWVRMHACDSHPAFLGSRLNTGRIATSACEPSACRTLLFLSVVGSNGCQRTVKTRLMPLQFFGGKCAPGGIRTHDPRLRRPILYPAELRAHRGGDTTRHRQAASSVPYHDHLFRGLGRRQQLEHGRPIACRNALAGLARECLGQLALEQAGSAPQIGGL